MHCSGILFMSYSVGLFFLSLQRTLLLKAFRPQICLYHYLFTSCQNPTFMRCKLIDILFSKALKFSKAAVLKQIQLFASAARPWLTARSPRSTALDLSDSSPVGAKVTTHVMLLLLLLPRGLWRWARRVWHTFYVNISSSLCPPVAIRVWRRIVTASLGTIMHSYTLIQVAAEFPHATIFWSARNELPHLKSLLVYDLAFSYVSCRILSIIVFNNR